MLELILNLTNGQRLEYNVNREKILTCISGVSELYLNDTLSRENYLEFIDKIIDIMDELKCQVHRWAELNNDNGIN